MLSHGASAPNDRVSPADGASFLHFDPSGVLVRGTAATDQGSVTFEQGVSCGVSTTLKSLSGMSWLSDSSFSPSSPRQLWIYTSPEWGDPDRYTFVGP